MITKPERVGWAVVALLAGLSLFVVLRACRPDKSRATVDVLMMGGQLCVISNVIEVVPKHDREQCNLVRYVDGGNTKEFHAWMAEVLDHDSGKVLAPGPTKIEQEAMVKLIEAAVAEEERRLAK